MVRLTPLYAPSPRPLVETSNKYLNDDNTTAYLVYRKEDVPHVDKHRSEPLLGDVVHPHHQISLYRRAPSLELNRNKTKRNKYRRVDRHVLLFFRLGGNCTVWLCCQILCEMTCFLSSFAGAEGSRGRKRLWFLPRRMCLWCSELGGLPSQIDERRFAFCTHVIARW